MIDAQAVTGRMLHSLSSSSLKEASLLNGYLQAFGITGVKDLSVIPPVFKDKHQPEWGAFVTEYSLAGNIDSQERRVLYTVLNFVRYMKHMRINPFIRTVKAPRAVKQRNRMDLQSVYSNLLTASFEDTLSLVGQELRKTHLFASFIAKGTAKTQVIKTGLKYIVCSSYAMVPRIKTAHVDAVLPSLQGFLYSGHDVPEQLRDKYQLLPPGSKQKPKSLRDKSINMLSETSALGWLVLRKTHKFSLYLKRAKDGCLVLRIEVPFTTDLDLKHTAQAVILNAWKTAFYTFK